MRTLWITGAAGLLGSHVVARVSSGTAFDRVVAVTRTAVPDEGGLSGRAAGTVIQAQLDICDREAVLATAARFPPSVVVNAVATADVDTCERHREEAWRVNVEGPRTLAEVCRDRAAALIHLSTDYVFPGDDASPGPYSEHAAPRPINWYGQTKLGGEHAVASVCGEDTPWAVVRTAFVYSASRRVRRDFVHWLCEELTAGRRVRIAVDQVNTPTAADDLAATLVWLAEHGVTGVYHASGPELVSRREWALAIAGHFRLSLDTVEWVTTQELQQAAPRPLRTGLLCPRLKADQARGAPGHRGIVAGLCDFDPC